MKAILLSVHPKWNRKIEQRIKVYEARKTRPSIDLPFKVYIYETKGRTQQNKNGPLMQQGRGMVTSEFICDEIIPFDSAFDEWAHATAPPGSTIDSIGWDRFLEIAHNGACLTREDINTYWPEDINAQMWHISNLNVYDNPKPLSEFYAPPELYCEKERCGGCPKDQVMGLDGDYAFDCEWKRPILRAPQSYCFVEELP